MRDAIFFKLWWSQDVHASMRDRSSVPLRQLYHRATSDSIQKEGVIRTSAVNRLTASPLGPNFLRTAGIGRSVRFRARYAYACIRSQKPALPDTLLWRAQSCCFPLLFMTSCCNAFRALRSTLVERASVEKGWYGLTKANS